VIGPALERVFRAASGRIMAALAARFRDLTLAEDAFSEACVRALADWPTRGVPDDPAAWLYRTASRIVLDHFRQNRVRDAHRIAMMSDDFPGIDLEEDDRLIIPDERLRLIFVCCHPAVAEEARAALTLKLVCGLSTTEIARAFLVSEVTLAQRLLRAKRKIAGAGVPFELPPPAHWPERMDAVLSTLEIAYSKAHEDASGAGSHSGFASEVLHLTGVLTELVPTDSESWSLAALVRYAEARRPARVDTDGLLVPLSEQDPALWNRDLIEEADACLARALALGPPRARAIQAKLQALWSRRRSLVEAPPWQELLRGYDELITIRDDVVVRINRAVAVAEVSGPAHALLDLAQLSDDSVAAYIPYHAVRADLFARTGQPELALQAYETLLALGPTPTEERWIRQKAALLTKLRSSSG
jgi:RNA polymerase sigma-70 factor (ECF subfamily)